jgi:ferritin-like metal-binding protein YciE
MGRFGSNVALNKGWPALDAGRLAAAQAVEHYKIFRCATLIAWAKSLVLKTPCLF